MPRNLFLRMQPWAGRQPQECFDTFIADSGPLPCSVCEDLRQLPGFVRNGLCRLTFRSPRVSNLRGALPEGESLAVLQFHKTCTWVVSLPSLVGGIDFSRNRLLSCWWLHRRQCAFLRTHSMCRCTLRAWVSSEMCDWCDVSELIVSGNRERHELL